MQEKKTKYEVQFEDGTIVKVKESHLLGVAQNGQPYKPGALGAGIRVMSRSLM